MPGRDVLHDLEGLGNGLVGHIGRSAQIPHPVDIRSETACGLVVVAGLPLKPKSAGLRHEPVKRGTPRTGENHPVHLQGLVAGGGLEEKPDPARVEALRSQSPGFRVDGHPPGPRHGSIAARDAPILTGKETLLPLQQVDPGPQVGEERGELHAPAPCPHHGQRDGHPVQGEGLVGAQDGLAVRLDPGHRLRLRTRCQQDLSGHDLRNRAVPGRSPAPAWAP